MLGQAVSSPVQNNETNCELGMSKNLIPVTVNKRPTLAILDTGAAVSCISVQFARILHHNRRKLFFCSFPLFNHQMCSAPRR